MFKPVMNAYQDLLVLLRAQPCPTVMRSKVDRRFRGMVFGIRTVLHTVGVNKKLTLRFRLYSVNTIHRVAKKKDYETIPYKGDNRVDETIEAFFVKRSCKRATVGDSMRGWC